MARAPVFRCNDPLSGFPYQVGFTVGKSLLQKAVRQGLHSCAHSATLAAQRLSSEQKYPALWTNWCNRIRVIAFEDCACCPSAIARVMRIGDDMDPSAAAEIAARLSLVPHSRMGSWLRACFAVQDTKLRAAVLDKYKRAAGAAVIDVAEANDWSWKQSSRSMRNALKDIDGSSDMVKLVRAIPVFEKAMRASRKTANAAWEAILTHARGSMWESAVQALHTLYRKIKQNKEGPCIYIVALAWMQFPDAFVEPNALAEGVWSSRVDVAPDFALPEHFVDLHTAEGRRRGLTSVDFAIHGAAVVRFMGPFGELEQVYIANKTLTEGKKRKAAAPAEPAPATKRTKVPQERATDEMSAFSAQLTEEHTVQMSVVKDTSDTTSVHDIEASSGIAGPRSEDARKSAPLAIPAFLRNYLLQQFTFTPGAVHKMNFKRPHVVLLLSAHEGDSRGFVVKGPFLASETTYMERTWRVYPDNPPLIALEDCEQSTMEFDDWAMDCLRTQQHIPGRTYTEVNFKTWYNILQKASVTVGASSKYLITEHVPSTLLGPADADTCWKSLFRVLLLRKLLCCTDTNCTNIVVATSDRTRVLSTDLNLAPAPHASPLFLFTAQRWKADTVRRLSTCLKGDKATAVGIVKEAVTATLEAEGVGEFVNHDALDAFCRLMEQSAEHSEEENEHWKRSVQRMLYAA